MSRSRKKEQKRREEYNKAVKHKMESAADLADKYSRAYELSSKEKSSIRLRNRKIVNRKLFLILGTIAVYTLALFALIMLVFFPCKNKFKDVFETYFDTEKPRFVSYELNDEFIGSTNETERVHYTDVDIPDINCYYASLSGEKITSRIYYGVSEQALLSGVGHVSVTSMPGFGKPVMLYGYSGTYLQGAKTLEEGDILTVTTNYGIYKYQVTHTSVFSDGDTLPYDLDGDTEQLIVCADYPFEKYKSESQETFCIIADKVSGPEIFY